MSLSFIKSMAFRLSFCFSGEQSFFVPCTLQMYSKGIKDSN